MKLDTPKTTSLALSVGAAVALTLGACGGSGDDFSGVSGDAGGSGGTAGTGGSTSAGGSGASGKGGAPQGAGGSAGTGGKGGAGHSGTGGAPAGGMGGGSPGAGGMGGKGAGAGGTGGNAPGAGGMGGNAPGAGGMGGGSPGAGGMGGNAPGAGGMGGNAPGAGGMAGNAAGPGGMGGTGPGAGGAAGSGGAAGTTGTGGSAGAAGAGTGGGGAGGAPACSPDGSSCTTAGAKNGLCTQATCADCNDPTDDGACTAAYGAPSLCLAGSCTAGDCRTTPDCVGSKGADVCMGNQCTPCDAVGTTYFVDPVNGDDTRATGSGTAGGAANSACSFKTVTAALKALVTSTAPLTVDILGTSTVGPGESFPFAIPANTTITASHGAVTVLVPAGVSGFVIAKTKSHLDGGAVGITVDGQGLPDPNASSQQHGLLVSSGSDVTSTVTNVTFTGFADEAIAANQGGLGIGQGVTVTQSGQPPAANGFGGKYGIRVGDGAATVGIDVTAGQPPVLVVNNKGGGIQIQGQATFLANGVPGASLGTGTIVVEGNAGPGVFSTAGGNGVGSTTLVGVVLHKNGASSGGLPWSGARVGMGSTFSMRKSVSLGNGAHGVHVVANPGISLASPLANIELGRQNFGLNVLQDDNDTNAGTGICLDFGMLTALNQKLDARGNFFANADCSTKNDKLTESKPNGSSCGGGTDVGVIGVATDTIDVSMCTYP